MQDTSTRRWTRRKSRPPVSLSDVAVWVTFTILTAAVLLAMCMMLTVLWPATP